ncbi:MAG: TetR/AcrR family transcriptional regulator [Spirochaetes bacterium]|nr:TetR/AcrR family transcriptional regulator [Spirochaetota bacterium]
MGNRAEQVAKQRENILNTSLKLFVTNGYHGTTVRDIAKKTGISVGLIFHYFPAKQDILKELLKQSEEGVSKIKEFLASENDPVNIFSGIAKAILESFSEENTKYLFLLENQVMTQKSIPFNAKTLKKSNLMINASVPLIISGQKNKSIKSGDPLTLALVFWGAIQGLAETFFWHPEALVPDYNCIADILRKN